MKSFRSLISGNFERVDDLWSNTLRIHVLNRSGCWSRCDSVDCIKCQSEKTISSPGDEGRGELFGTFNSLVLDNKTSQSNSILENYEMRNIYKEYSVNISRSTRTISIANFPGRTNHRLCSGGFGGIVDSMTFEIRFGQFRRKHEISAHLEQGEVPQRSELPVSKSKCRVTACAPSPIVTGQRYMESF